MPDNVLAYSPTVSLIESHVAIYKIYVLKNPITDEIFYVGQTMQELIEWIDEKFKDSVFAEHSFIKDKARGLLEKERHQIVMAAWYGNARASVEDKRAFGEKYFTTTFKQQ